MHLLMKTSLSGPAYNFQRGAQVPFDDSFPFSAGEVRRFIDPAGADMAEFVGDTADLEAWLAQWVEPMPSLYGSSILPAIVEIAGYQIQLGGIVNVGFADFVDGLEETPDERTAIEAWNDLTVDEREVRLRAVIDQLTDEPDAIVDVVAETSIVDRPAAPVPAETPAADAGATDAAATETATETKPAPRTRGAQKKD